MNIQKSNWVRIIKFIIGGIAVVFSGYRFFNITNASPFFATYPGIVVLVIGTVNILKGILNKGDSKMTRTIEIGIGIIAIIVGLFVKVYLTDASSSLIWFIFLIIIIQGSGFVAIGITRSGGTKTTRISKIVIGVAILTLTGLLFEYHDLSIITMGILLSINLLINGIEIITGAIGHKIVKRS